MLELSERWLRSIGVDLFDLLAVHVAADDGAWELMPKYLLVGVVFFLFKLGVDFIYFWMVSICSFGDGVFICFFFIVHTALWGINNVFVVFCWSRSCFF